MLHAANVNLRFLRPTATATDRPGGGWRGEMDRAGGGGREEEEEEGDV